MRTCVRANSWFPAHLFILYLLQNACIALQRQNQVHVTLYRRLIVCHSVLVNPENVISSCGETLASG